MQLMNKVEKKRLKEQQTIEKMIHLYCKKNHHTSKLCPECQELLDYAKARSRRCPFMEEKTFCAHCKVHCFLHFPAPSLRGHKYIIKLKSTKTLVCISI